MIDINVFWEFINTITNKDQVGGFSPAQFNSAIPVVVGIYVDKIKAKLREFQLVQNKNYALIAKYENYLLEITKRTNVSVSSFGFASLPSDWTDTRGLNYNYITQNPLSSVPYPIREVTQTDFASYVSSQLNKPEKKQAVACYYSGQLRFSPSNLGSAEIIYYYDYPDPFWAYTMVNNQETYTSGTGDNGTSVQIPLAPQCNNDLAMIFCNYLGLAIKEEWLEQFSQGEEVKNDN